MGESKRRKESDPSYGTRPKRGRGIMLLPDLFEGESPGLKVTENGIEGPAMRIPSMWRPEQVRFGLCFWDRIAWPSISIMPSSSSTDMDFLESAGVLVRPKAILVPNLISPGKGFAETYFRAYQDLEEKEPGQWSLSASAEYDLKSFLGDRLVPDRGITVSLHQAIPIPTGNVALEDLLEFKQKRTDELDALRKELDSYKQLVTSATDRAEVFATQRDRIDVACVDLITVIREKKIPIYLSDMSFEIDLKGSAVATMIDATIALSDNLDLHGVNKYLAILGVTALSSIKLKSGSGIRSNKTKLRQNSFRYVYHLHQELDWL